MVNFYLVVASLLGSPAAMALIAGIWFVLLVTAFIKNRPIFAYLAQMIVLLFPFYRVFQYYWNGINREPGANSFGIAYFGLIICVVFGLTWLTAWGLKPATPKTPPT
jgi:hypothetical protein